MKIVLIGLLLSLGACSSLQLMRCSEHVQGEFYKCKKP
jgi:hypothetical protein